MISLITFIKTTPTEVVPSPPIKPLNETLEILTKVNEFYDSAWSKLIFLLAGAFAVLGVIMPFVIQYFQNKSIKASEKELESKMNLQLIELKNTLKEDFSKVIDEKILEYKNDFELKIEKINANANGSSFHAQGNVNHDKKNYKEATRDYFYAIDSYIICEDYINLKAVIAGVLFCIDNLSKDDIDYLENVLSIDLSGTLDNVEIMNGGGAFTRDTRSIKSKILKILKSTPEVTKVEEKKY